jgi:transcription elongation GreA/GreB family factor
LAPAGGGISLAGGTVQVVTPRSPVGRALLGRRAGDLCEALGGARTRELVVKIVR